MDVLYVEAKQARITRLGPRERLMICFDPPTVLANVTAKFDQIECLLIKL